VELFYVYFEKLHMGLRKKREYKAGVGYFIVSF